MYRGLKTVEEKMKKDNIVVHKGLVNEIFLVSKKLNQLYYLLVNKF